MYGRPSSGPVRDARPNSGKRLKRKRRKSRRTARRKSRVRRRDRCAGGRSGERASAVDLARANNRPHRRGDDRRVRPRWRAERRSCSAAPRRRRLHSESTPSDRAGRLRGRARSLRCGSAGGRLLLSLGMDGFCGRSRLLPAAVVAGRFCAMARAMVRERCAAGRSAGLADAGLQRRHRGVVAVAAGARPVADLGFEQELGPVFALLSGAAAVTAAWPILRTTCLDPGREQPLAWFVGSGAYGIWRARGDERAGAELAAIWSIRCSRQAIHLLIGVFRVGRGRIR